MNISKLIGRGAASLHLKAMPQAIAEYRDVLNSGIKERQADAEADVDAYQARATAANNALMEYANRDDGSRGIVIRYGSSEPDRERIRLDGACNQARDDLSSITSRKGEATRWIAAARARLSGEEDAKAAIAAEVTNNVEIRAMIAQHDRISATLGPLQKGAAAARQAYGEACGRATTEDLERFSAALARAVESGGADSGLDDVPDVKPELAKLERAAKHKEGLLRGAEALVKDLAAKIEAKRKLRADYRQRYENAIQRQGELEEAALFHMIAPSLARIAASRTGRWGLTDIVLPTPLAADVARVKGELNDAFPAPMQVELAAVRESQSDADEASVDEDANA